MPGLVGIVRGRYQPTCSVQEGLSVLRHFSIYTARELRLRPRLQSGRCGVGRTRSAFDWSAPTNSKESMFINAFVVDPVQHRRLSARWVRQTRAPRSAARPLFPVLMPPPDGMERRLATELGPSDRDHAARALVWPHGISPFTYVSRERSLDNCSSARRAGRSRSRITP